MRFDIVKNRKWYFIISGLIAIVGIVLMLTMGLNLGTDFEAGSRLQFQVGHDFTEDELAHQMTKDLGIEISMVQKANGTDAIARIDHKITEQEEAKINDYLSQNYDKPAPQISSVDPTVARELANKAIWAIVWASLGIILYMAIRFEYRFAISGVISVLQVVLIVVSLFALLRLEIDISFIAAVLTIVGYSIHDTIVIFDRIRENLKHYKVKTTTDLEQLVNDSIWQTMTRSINTVLTVIFSAGMLYLIGGDAIKNFSLALLIGLVTGAYSSIFIASQIWVSWKSRELKKPKAA
ncbi:MAG TPA: protein translocase subunit SecF [Bacilli bacterium]|nr:protein translocase subunit SecF [Bacilli bacterium]